MQNLNAIDIRPYTEKDLPELRALHAMSFKALAAGSHSAEQIFAHIRFMNTDDYAADVARSNVLCARDERGDLCATAGWLRMDGAPDTARIRKVFVHPELSGQGLGRRMVIANEISARSHGTEDYFVRANINATGFYKRLGYREIKPGVMTVSGGINLPVMFMHKA
ncbi:GNAT family N-acetyltransferase [Magnetovibrio sp.]|uniref:GNAT family N-acetyltransferase n=1 Tax=Magnetovibrio sp. TaxID=2024836 RepID=UPI002F95D921